MNDELSILNSEVEIDLSTNRQDVIVMLTKGALGSAPVVGSLLSEILTQFIPNQKQERIAECLSIFADKVRYLESDFLAQKIKTEEFADLLEDVILSASRALTPERREYLASLLKNSITRDELDHLGQKKVLAKLNQLDDAEIVILKYLHMEVGVERTKFSDLHRPIITGYNPIPEDAPQEDKVRYVIFEERHQAIQRLGLQPSDPKKTNLGTLVLQYIDLIE